jgi:competence protein ComEC
LKEENDSSMIISIEDGKNNIKILLMSDASINSETIYLKKNKLSTYQILEVGHHGSKTSSSKQFIDVIKPIYSVISVGKNNIYGHPNKEVLENLKESKIYRTDEDGSIIFKIKNNKLKIETCAP